MNVWQPQLQFDTVKIFRHPEWPKYWLRDSKPGHIFVLPGTIGTVGGILRLTIDGIFVSVTADQLYSAATIKWPGRNPSIEGIQILGTKIKIVE